MPDVVKVLHAQNDIDLSEFVDDKVVLKTTAAGVTEIIKSVVFENDGGMDVALRVGGYDVVSLPASGSLEGWEVIPPSTEVALAFLSGFPKYWPWKVVEPSSTTVVLRRYNPLTQSSAPSGSGGTIVATGTALTNNNPTFNFTRPDNEDYYYALPPVDVTSTWTLYRRAGGVSGAQTTVGTMASVLRCTDGERYIFSVTSGGVVYVCDTNTNTITSRTVTGMTGVTTAWIIRFIEGRLFVGGTTTTFYHFEAFSAASASSFTIPNTSSPTIFPYNNGGHAPWAFAVMKSASTYYLHLYGSIHNADEGVYYPYVVVFSIGTNLASPSLTLVGFTTTTDPGLSAVSRHSGLALDNNSITMTVGGNSARVWVLLAGQVSHNYYTYSSLTDYGALVKPTTAQIEQILPALSIRISGVEQS